MSLLVLLGTAFAILGTMGALMLSIYSIGAMPLLCLVVALITTLRRPDLASSSAKVLWLKTLALSWLLWVILGTEYLLWDWWRAPTGLLASVLLAWLIGRTWRRMRPNRHAANLAKN